MRTGGLFWGVVVLIIGVVLLLNNFGLLGDMNLWGLILPLGLLVLGSWVLLAAFLGPSRFEVQEVEIPLGGASSGRITLHHGAGRMLIAGGAGTDVLLAGSFGGATDYTRRQVGNDLDVEMRLTSKGFPFFASPSVWGAGGMVWDMRLNGSVPLALDINTGASEARLDLSDLQVTHLRLETGASSCQVTLPAAAGRTRARISSGVASMVVRVPSGVAADIRVEAGLSGVDIDTTRFLLVGKDHYRSPDYDTAANRAELELRSGVGSLEVR